MDDHIKLPSIAEREIAIRRRVHRLAEFYRHVFVYVFANSAMWAMNFWMLAGSAAHPKWYAYWAIWPTLSWGIGLLSHGLSVMPNSRFFSADWEEKKVRDLLAKDAAQNDRAGRA